MRSDIRMVVIRDSWFVIQVPGMCIINRGPCSAEVAPFGRSIIWGLWLPID